MLELPTVSDINHDYSLFDDGRGIIRILASLGEGLVTVECIRSAFNDIGGIKGVRPAVLDALRDLQCPAPNANKAAITFWLLSLEIAAPARKGLAILGGGEEIGGLIQEALEAAKTAIQGMRLQEYTFLGDGVVPWIWINCTLPEPNSRNVRAWTQQRFNAQIHRKICEAVAIPGEWQTLYRAHIQERASQISFHKIYAKDSLAVCGIDQLPDAFSQIANIPLPHIDGSLMVYRHTDGILWLSPKKRGDITPDKKYHQWGDEILGVINTRLDIQEYHAEDLVCHRIDQLHRIYAEDIKSDRAGTVISSAIEELTTGCVFEWIKNASEEFAHGGGDTIGISAQLALAVDLRLRLEEAVAIHGGEELIDRLVEADAKIEPYKGSLSLLDEYTHKRLLLGVSFTDPDAWWS